MNSRIKHIDAVDHLRGAAIVAVLVYHVFLYTFGGDYRELPWNGWFRSFSVPESYLWFVPFSIANCGVPIFFVVSGFCIHLSFHQQGKEWKSFFVRRFFRIYPAYLAALVFSALLIFGRHFPLSLYTKDFWSEVLTHLFFIHNVNPTTFTGLNGPFWSLAVEVQLYVLYPALLALIGKIGWRRAMIVLAAVELLVHGFAGTVDTWVAPGSVEGFWGSTSWLVSHSPLGFWFSWALGAYIAEAFLNDQPLPFAGISAFWALALAIASYFLRPLFPLQFLLFSLTTACIAARLLSKSPARDGNASVASRLLMKLGLWSYSIYLLHMPLLSIFGFAVVRYIPADYLFPAASFSYLALSLLAILPVCVLWHHLFELPGIAFGKRIIRRMQTGTAAMPSKAPSSIAAVAGARGSYILMSCGSLVFMAATYWAHEKFTPFQPEDYNYRGLSLAQKGQVEEAISQFREAIRVKPEYASAHNNLGNALGAQGHIDEAIEQFREAIRSDKDNVEAHFNLGVALASKEQFDEAASQVLAASRLDPNLAKNDRFFGFVGGLNNRAWNLATSSDPKTRDGALAVKLARLACEATQYKETMIIGTLAAAYAEAGQFDDATATAQKACTLAEENGQAELLQKNRELLALYQKLQAYHE